MVTEHVIVIHSRNSRLAVLRPRRSTPWLADKSDVQTFFSALLCNTNRLFLRAAKIILADVLAIREMAKRASRKELSHKEHKEHKDCKGRIQAVNHALILAKHKELA